MPKVVAHSVTWIAAQNTYVIHEPGRPDSSPVPGEEQQWFTWLAACSSFAFQGKQGHLTLRKEARARNAGYWYAYRCQNRKTIKRYAGRTTDLAITRLEEIADEISAAFATARPPQEAPEPGPDLASPFATSPLLAPKLRLPHLHSSLVARERLLARLDACLERKLTMLCAPAGSGKTTLVRQWIAARSEQVSFPPIAWVSLDAGDNDPTRFWRYILVSSRTWHATPDQHALNLLLSSTQPYQPYMKPPTLEVVLTAFLNEVTQRNSAGLLILEDYHAIVEARIHETLDFFLSHLPETLHVVLITRQEPPLPLARLRANGDLNEIQAADLRFTAEESATFLQEFALSTEALERLDTHLEGWAAGLRLLFLSLQGKTTQPQIEHLLTTFSGSHRPILDYFVAEVLHAQPERLQDFLLRTSVLPRLNPSLCAAVTGMPDSAALLESIERANLFLEALDDPSARNYPSAQVSGEAGEWYRYHALFAEAMQHEARRRLGAEELRALSYTACRWFEQHGLLAEAIEAALKAGENAHAVALIEQFIQPERFQEAQEHLTIRRWLEQLPEPHLKQSPLLCLAYAATLIFARDQQPPDAATASRIEGMMEEMLQVAEEGWRARDDLARLGEVYALRAFLTFQQGKRDQAVSYAGQALTWLPKKNAMWRGLTLSTLGIDALLAGQLNEARPLFQEVASLWEVAGNEHALNGVRFMLGVICLEQGEIHQAARHYRKLNQAGLNDMSIMAHLGQIQIYYEWNDLEALRQQAHEIERLVDQITEIPTAILHLLIEMVQARLDHTQGETERAIQRLTDALSHLPPYLEESFFFYQEALAWLIRHSLSLGDIATAQHWFNKLVGHHDRARPIPGTLALAAPAETQTPEPDEPGELAPIQNRIETSPVFQEQKALLMARIFLAQREADDALTTLSYVLPAAQAAGRERNVLQIKLLMAQAYAARTQLPEARQLLIEALEQGYPQGFQRLFLDEGEGLFPLLRDLLPHLPGQPLHGYVRLLLQAFAQTQASQPIIVTPIAVPLIEPLSAQEQRVLRLLVAGRSNPEIALELVVSVNTIRTQVQSIYRKLNVHNRNAASEVARQLQLV